MINAELADIEDMPEAVNVPIEDILRQHRKRFIVHTSAHGDVVMRYMTRSARIRMDRLRREMWPELRAWEDELMTKAPLASLPGADEGIVREAQEVALKMMPTLDMYALACIVTPELGSVEDLRIFMDILTPEESEAVRQILTLCTAHAPPVDTEYMELAERFGVQVIDPVLLDHMTMQQQEVLTSILSAERRQERELMKKMGMRA